MLSLLSATKNSVSKIKMNFIVLKKYSKDSKTDNQAGRTQSVKDED